MNKATKLLFWPLFFLCQLIALALISWHLLAQVHFAYPSGYTLLDLNPHINHFAPLNHYKRGFEQTDAKEHQRLFGAITDAVQNSGEGLEAISYPLADGTRVALLHNAEVVHLQDVANLIDRFYWFGNLCLLTWLAMIAAARRWKLGLPPPKRVLLGFLVGLMLIALVIVLIGPKEVFYWLHIKIFPAENQWFFYYQESLMTTLMKAPDIFAFITLLLVSLLIALWLLSVFGLKRLLRGTDS